MSITIRSATNRAYDNNVSFGNVQTVTKKAGKAALSPLEKRVESALKKATDGLNELIPSSTRGKTPEEVRLILQGEGSTEETLLKQLEEMNADVQNLLHTKAKSEPLNTGNQEVDHFIPFSLEHMKWAMQEQAQAEILKQGKSPTTQSIIDTYTQTLINEGKRLQRLAETSKPEDGKLLALSNYLTFLENNRVLAAETEANANVVRDSFNKIAGNAKEKAANLNREATEGSFLTRMYLTLFPKRLQRELAEERAFRAEEIARPCEETALAARKTEEKLREILETITGKKS